MTEGELRMHGSISCGTKSTFLGRLNPHFLSVSYLESCVIAGSIDFPPPRVNHGIANG